MAIAGKRIPDSFLRIFALTHLAFAVIIALIILFTKQSILNHWLILLLLCTGLIFSGIILRKEGITLLKLYFVLFPFSIVLFIYSPTRFFKTIYTGKISNLQSEEIKLADNYFIIKQDIFTENDSEINYKIFRKKGIISETVATDISLPAKIDSVEVLQIKPEDTLILRTYNTLTGIEEIGVSLKIKSKNKITRQ